VELDRFAPPGVEIAVALGIGEQVGHGTPLSASKVPVGPGPAPRRRCREADRRPWRCHVIFIPRKSSHVRHRFRARAFPSG
jgi:hypothetical protein